jgi:hypothetical protein
MNLNFVRGTYWLAAIAYVLAAVQLMMPTSMTVLGFPGLRAPGAAGQPAVVAAVLSVGWSFVLVWAHLRTRQRRAILSISLGITFAMAGVNLLLGLSGAVPWDHLVGTLVFQAVFAVLFGTSVRIARRAAITTGVA